jgi:cytochrome c-type biogenesis protein CcmE
MDPNRKRKIRFTVLIGVALLLATALVYTSFSASTEARTPSQLVAVGKSGETYELTGRVVEGSVNRADDVLRFKVADRTGGGDSVSVRYEGTVPDPFKEGREVIVTGRLVNGALIAEPGSLITKCPSKFTKKQSEKS